MKTWSILVVTLTDACVDVIKLAMLDIASDIKPGIDKDRYTSYCEENLGCTFDAQVTLKIDKAEEAFKIVEKTLAARNIQFLSLIVTEMSGGVVSHGNIKRTIERVDSIYRKPPVPEP